MRGVGLILACGVAALTSLASAETYVGAAGGIFLPAGGTSARHRAGGLVRGGTYLSETVAVEGAAGCFDSAAELTAQGLVHASAWEMYNRFFGFSPFDPFVTVGVTGWWGDDANVGPTAGIGAFYHLTEHVSLRAEGAAILALAGKEAVDYRLTAGIQWTF